MKNTTLFSLFAMSCKAFRERYWTNFLFTRMWSTWSVAKWEFNYLTMNSVQFRSCNVVSRYISLIKLQYAPFWSLVFFLIHAQASKCGAEISNINTKLCFTLANHLLNTMSFYIERKTCWFKPSYICIYMYIYDSVLVFTITTDVVAPIDPQTSPSTVMAIYL